MKRIVIKIQKNKMPANPVNKRIHEQKAKK